MTLAGVRVKGGGEGGGTRVLIANLTLRNKYDLLLWIG